MAFGVRPKKVPFSKDVLRGRVRVVYRSVLQAVFQPFVPEIGDQDAISTHERVFRNLNSVFGFEIWQNCRCDSRRLEDGPDSGSGKAWIEKTFNSTCNHSKRMKIRMIWMNRSIQ